MTVRWTFWDPQTIETYTFEVNPNEGGSPNYDKTLTYQNTTAPDGRVLVFEGGDEVRIIEFSGVILTQDHYEAFADWYQRRNQILLTDDLGREFWIYISSFKPTRNWKASHPWHHTYTMRSTIVDEP